MHHTDRSRIETGQTCGRKRFWGYHLPGLPVPGVTPRGAKWDLEFGKAIHAVLEGKSLELGFLDAMQDTTPDGLSQSDEWAALGQGLARTWLAMKPVLEQEYEFVASELEVSAELGDGIQLNSRLDGVWRQRADGMLYVLEAKTTAWPERLGVAARDNLQLLLECEMLRRNVALVGGGQVGGALLLTLNKGRKQAVSAYEKKKGLEGYRRLSPFTYWFQKDYANGTTGYGLEWKSGWERQATWTLPLDDWFGFGMSNWEPDFLSQIQLWPGVSFDRQRAESVIEQIVAQEQRFALGDKILSSPTEYDDEVKQTVIDRTWPQNALNCHNDSGFGRECPFLGLCRTNGAYVDPELFEPREANHPQELESI